MARLTYPSLEHVAMDACPYPAALLGRCESGLILFAAAFLGRNDAIHFAEAGVPFVTLVDVDGLRLEEMADLYRGGDDWRFVEMDAWAFAANAREVGAKWDAVSVDTFTGTATDRSLRDLEAWTSIASRVVTATATADAEFEVPVGWKARLFDREGAIEAARWLILEAEE